MIRAARRFCRDTTLLTGRSLRHVVRSPDTVVTTAVVPVAVLLLFVYVLGGAIDVGTGGPGTGRRGEYATYLLPGVLLMTVASGVSYTAYRVFLDLRGGFFDRFASLPISRASVLWAHVLTSLVANLVSVAVVVGVAVLVGFRSPAGPPAWCAAAGLLVLVTLAMTWLAVHPGLTARTVEGVSAFSYPLVFLPFLSSAFVPTDTMPGPVRWFAEHQPVTPVVDALRALFAGNSVGDRGGVAVAWCVGVTVVAVAVAVRTARRPVR